MAFLSAAEDPAFHWISWEGWAARTPHGHWTPSKAPGDGGRWWWWSGWGQDKAVGEGKQTKYSPGSNSRAGLGALLLKMSCLAGVVAHKYVTLKV